MKCIILQPSYIPWRGYFDQISKADVFVYYDDVPYSHHDWRNRNQIKTPHGKQWLTIPVQTSGKLSQQALIKDIAITPGQTWLKKHWRSIEQNYQKAPCWKECSDVIASLYSHAEPLLADYTIRTTEVLADYLGFTTTRFIRSSELNIPPSEKTDRLVHILKAVGADHYISGPSARDYLNEAQLTQAGITLEYMRYDYPPYEQLYPPYDPQVSVIDLICMTGKNSRRYICGENDTQGS